MAAFSLAYPVRFNISLLPSFDPRWYQLSVQAALLGYGLLVGLFEVSLIRIAVVLLAALTCQKILTHWRRLPFNALSAVNAAMSVLLLLQASGMAWLVLAAVLAISSKFFLRYGAYHWFNPSNVGIVAVLLLTDSAWVSHGQWGQLAFLGVLLAGLGLIPLLGFKRVATSWSFLLTFAGLAFFRGWYLGDDVSIVMHQLENSALLIFAFFMLGDPKTTPNGFWVQCLYGMVLALLAYVLRFDFYIPNAFLYALAIMAPFAACLKMLAQREDFYWKNSQ